MIATAWGTELIVEILPYGGELTTRSRLPATASVSMIPASSLKETSSSAGVASKRVSTG